MTGARTLPITVHPAEGESFGSYLDRLAESLGAPLLTLLARTGVIPEESFSAFPVGYGILLPPERLQALAAVTRLSEESVSDMLLFRYDGVCCDLSTLDSSSPQSFTRTSREEWAYFGGSHVCPDCIGQTGGVWKLAWKLPWSFACVEHGRLLADTCPACEKRLGIGRQDGRSAPAFPSLVPTPQQCRNTLPKGMTSAGRASRPCGHPLVDISTLSMDSRSYLLDAQRRLDALLAGEEARVAGEKVSTFEYFFDLRSLAALFLSAGEVADLDTLPGKVPSVVRHAVALHTDRRESIVEERAERVAAGDDWRTGPRMRPYTGAPQSAALMAGIAPVAMEILDTNSSEELSDNLVPFVERMRRTITNVPVRISYFRLSSRLEKAFERCWQPHQKLTTRLGMTAKNAERANAFWGNLTPDDVPQLFWPDGYEGSLAELLPGVLPDHARRVCSMWLLKALTGCTWETAATTLGLPSRQARGMANKVVSLLTANNNAELFDSRLRAVVRKVADEPGRIDYGARRRALVNLTDIEREEWKGICKAAGVHPGKRGGKSRYAAAWLWSHLTEGDYRCSPGFRAKDGETERELYRRFVKCDLPPLEAALVQYDSSLTANPAVPA